MSIPQYLLDRFNIETARVVYFIGTDLRNEYQRQRMQLDKAGLHDWFDDATASRWARNWYYNKIVLPTSYDWGASPSEADERLTQYELRLADKNVDWDAIVQYVK